jgi:nicotinamidase-related amidase
MSTTALLVCDVQNGIVERIPGLDTKAYLQNLVNTIQAARAANHRVIYVRVAFRSGHPEASPRNASFARVKTMGGFLEHDPSTQIHETVAPQAEDIVVIKRRVSAFHGTDLDLVLRSLGIETLVICGLSTSGVVMSTVRQGSDLDYKLVVLEDLARDTEQAMHDACVKILAKQAQIINSEEWIAGL